ncbi:MAG: hypothetical protein WD929_00515 [Steroidobacteraceae bacterium]
MAANMTIHVDVDNGTTVSKFLVGKDDQVTIVNDASGPADIAFGGASPLCTTSGQQMSIQIPVSGSQAYSICPNSEGNSFAYVATVANAAPGDAHLMVTGVTGPSGNGTVIGVDTGPSIIFESLIYTGGIIAVVGVLVGYVLARYFGGHRT